MVSWHVVHNAVRLTTFFFPGRIVSTFVGVTSGRFAPLPEHVFGVRLRVLKNDDPLVSFVVHATFLHPYVEAVPFACRGHVLPPSLRFDSFLHDEVVCFR